MSGLETRTNPTQVLKAVGSRFFVCWPVYRRQTSGRATSLFLVALPPLETFGPRSGTWGCPALHWSFFFCSLQSFFFIYAFVCLFFKINIWLVAFFRFLNKTKCFFILHNTINPLHVQYQCPITDYMYGKRSQMSCIKKIWDFYWRKWREQTSHKISAPLKHQQPKEMITMYILIALYPQCAAAAASAFRDVPSSPFFRLKEVRWPADALHRTAWVRTACVSEFIDNTSSGGERNGMPTGEGGGASGSRGASKKEREYNAVEQYSVMTKCDSLS